MKLHVIFLEVHPVMVDLGISPAKRLVTLELTDAQVKALKPRYLGQNGGKPVWEAIDQAFLEGNQYDSLYETKQDGRFEVTMPRYFEDNEKCGWCDREPGERHKAGCRQ